MNLKTGELTTDDEVVPYNKRTTDYSSYLWWGEDGTGFDEEPLTGPSGPTLYYGPRHPVRVSP